MELQQANKAGYLVILRAFNLAELIGIKIFSLEKLFGVTTI